MNKKATAEVQPPQKSGESRLVLLSKDSRGANHARVVSQLRLARIQHLQSEVAYMQGELGKEWDAVRRDLLEGAIVEKGPLRAWIKCILRLGRAKTIDAPDREVRKTLMVK